VSEPDIEKVKIKLQEYSIKEDRKKYLKNTDWTMLADAPLSNEAKKEIRAYRQYLRDFPELWKNKQITEYRVLPFDQWQDNKPVYKVEKKNIF
jgi:hypothetical protein